MTFRQASISLAKTGAMPADRGEMGEDDPLPLTMGMMLPLLWSGRALSGPQSRARAQRVRAGPPHSVKSSLVLDELIGAHPAGIPLFPSPLIL